MAEQLVTTTILSQAGWETLLGPDDKPIIAHGAVTVAGIQIEHTRAGLFFTAKYVGNENVPQDIRRLRRQVYEIMRRMGQPIIIKHMFNDDDVAAGVAEKSANFDSVYGQVRNQDPLSYGIGYVSTERSTDEWINTTTGAIITQVANPGASFVPAPRYRGFGPGVLTYIIEPDAAEDFFRLTPQGALLKVQTAQAQAPWWPDINDNDLLINVTTDNFGNVVQANERYQAKMTNPVSIRGLDRRGRSEFSGDPGNRHVVNQTFPMTLVPSNNILQRVDIDR